MKWGHRHVKFPKVDGPSWEFPQCGWKNKGNNHIPTISPKSFPTWVNRFFSKIDPREFLPGFFLQKKRVTFTMCLTCSNMFKINFQIFSKTSHNITIHLGCPKQITPNMFRALSPSTRAHSQVSTCANFYSTLPIFNRIQAEAGVIRWK